MPSLNSPRLATIEAQRIEFRSRTLEDANGCWLWQRYLINTGYGRVQFNGKATLAHRVAYLLWTGPIPSKHVIAHRCDVPRCCNPDHLFLATHVTNVMDFRLKLGDAGPERCAANEILDPAARRAAFAAIDGPSGGHPGLKKKKASRPLRR